MGLLEDIKQQKEFQNEYSKAAVNIVYTNSWLSRHHASLMKPHGLTSPQYNILRILRGQYPNPATVNLLIDRMLDKSSNASRIVDKLEEKELVQRHQCLKDRRAVDVIITQKGLDLLSEIDLEIETLDEEVSNLTEEECKMLNDLLDKLRGN